MTKLKPYVLPRPFSGYNIPIAMQTSFIKQYCEHSGYKFSLPIAELTTSNSYQVLEEYLDEVKNVDLGIVSIFVLPIHNKNLMRRIYNKINKKKILFHAILESEILSKEDLLNWGNEFSDLNSMSVKYESNLIKKLITDKNI